MALSHGKIAGLLGAVLLIALLAFAAGFLLGLSTAADLGDTAQDAGSASSPAVAAVPDGRADGDAGAAGAGPKAPDGAAASHDTAAGNDGASASPSAPADDTEPDGPGAPEPGGGAAVDAGPTGYSVQAGEHAVAARATAAANRLIAAGFAARVVQLGSPDGPWFRVVVDGFDSRARAAEAAMQIRTELGVDALIAPPPAQAANAGADR
ncbi:hypothetical protein CKO28_03730 [Rhodovibrio sodomensis]|uniref:SPOR domain-containing protein n=1 Tax=Rhodovibrio sodomensis TaxID=1088 RepID=A0ABS1DAA1_9PROT|nr:SPOR domain-containing protein [Rhodovibrio sodomensis]MBK1667154.1 hypothetical protein [Rhodovibrio sodomensis]